MGAKFLLVEKWAKFQSLRNWLMFSLGMKLVQPWDEVALALG